MIIFAQMQAWHWWLGAVGAVVILLLGVVVSILLWGDTLRRRKRIADHLLKISSHLVQEPANRVVQSELLKALSSNYVFERFFALHTFGELYEDVMKQDLPRVVLDDFLHECARGLLHGLADESPFVRNAAAQSLSRIGDKAGFAIESLARTLQEHPHEGAGMYAAVALRNIGNPSELVLSALRSVGEHPLCLSLKEADTTYRSLTNEALPINWARVPKSQKDDLEGFGHGGAPAGA